MNKENCTSCSKLYNILISHENADSMNYMTITFSQNSHGYCSQDGWGFKEGASMRATSGSNRKLYKSQKIVQVVENCTSCRKLYKRKSLVNKAREFRALKLLYWLVHPSTFVYICLLKKMDICSHFLALNGYLLAFACSSK